MGRRRSRASCGPKTALKGAWFGEWGKFEGATWHSSLADFSRKTRIAVHFQDQNTAKQMPIESAGLLTWPCSTDFDSTQCSRRHQPRKNSQSKKHVNDVLTRVVVKVSLLHCTLSPRTSQGHSSDKFHCQAGAVGVASRIMGKSLSLMFCKTKPRAFRQLELRTGSTPRAWYRFSSLLWQKKRNEYSQKYSCGLRERGGKWLGYRSSLHRLA